MEYNYTCYQCNDMFKTVLIQAVSCNLCGSDFIELTFQQPVPMGPIPIVLEEERPLEEFEIEDFKKISITQDQVDEGLQCTVCLAEFELEEGVRQLHCDHKFHEECLESWLVEHDTCPCCRQMLEENADHLHEGNNDGDSGEEDDDMDGGDGNHGESMDGGDGEYVDGGDGEYVDGGDGEYVDGGDGEYVDGGDGEYVDGGDGEYVDGGDGEYVDGGDGNHGESMDGGDGNHGEYN